MTWEASIPMGTASPMGSQPSQTEKTISSSRASQKAGVLEMTRQYPRMSRSGSRPRAAPASRPRVTPRTPDKTQAVSIRPMELMRRCPMTSMTGCR